MTIILILSLLTGAVLGMRLRVFILIPATGLVLALIAGGGLVRGDVPSAIVIAMAMAAFSLQLGYLGGSTTRFVVAAARIARRASSADQTAGLRRSA
jgi:hypothetical protein